MVIFDMAVPRDFDPRIHDGDRVCVFNVDDLTQQKNKWVAERRKHILPAEAIIDGEVTKFVADWNRRRNGPVIGQLTAEVDRVRQSVLGPLLEKLNGQLTEADRAYIEGAFRLFQNKLLHGPIAALQEASRDDHSSTLREALMKLFGLKG
jgi:glutamyl-tRNA reductase